MVTLEDLISLFSSLAVNLQTQPNTSPTNHHRQNHHQQQAQNDDDDDLDLSISNLTRSLNFSDDRSAVRVLDTALSLMCFKAPQVFDSMIQCSVETIVTVLTSSIKCKALRYQEKYILVVGSSIPLRDCVDLIEVVTDVISKLEDQGRLHHLLLRAVVRILVSASSHRYSVPSRCMNTDVESMDGRGIDVTKLHRHLPEEFPLENNEIPLRLCFWYLDPLILKKDISEILKETIKRPFLCIRKEFYERMDWRSIIVCLVLSPVIFIDSRTLLHDWFLLTGLGSILELLIDLVRVILDVISRPMWWGMSMELGSKLPFSNAYFPYKHHSLRILTGPFSAENFVQLVHGSKSVSGLRKQFSSTTKPPAVNTVSIDHRSIWALAISFPDWFYFASALLFSGSSSFPVNPQSKCTTEAPKTVQRNGLEPPSYANAAARYIAWILSPANKSNQDQLFDCLIKISECWTLKQVGSGAHEKRTAGYGKKVKKQKLGLKADYTHGYEYDCQVVSLWLEQFQNMFKYSNAPSHGLASSMFRRIPLGILIGCSCNINEDGCESLLQFAATGRLANYLETKSASLRHAEQMSGSCNRSVFGSSESSKMEAVAAARLVFNLTDTAERMSASLFETEESGLEFICQVKLRSGKYLVNCIKRLTRLCSDKHGILMLRDLLNRLENWRHQGGEVLELHRDLDDAIKELNLKLSVEIF